jgi:hypothetical protein
MTEKRREEIAAPAIVARIRTLSRDSTVSDVCGDILVRNEDIVSNCASLSFRGASEKRRARGQRWKHVWQK